MTQAPITRNPQESHGQPAEQAPGAAAVQLLTRRERRSPRSWKLAPLLGLAPLVLTLLVWELVATDRAFTFPPPSSWWEAGKGMWEAGELGSALGQTLATFVLGCAAAVTLGVLVGWLIGASRTTDRALSPLLELLRCTPAPALVPVATVIFGVTTRMSVVVMVISVIWPVLLSTTSARQNIPQVRLDAGRVLGVGLWSRMRKIVLPSLLPEIMTGARVTVSLGFVVSLLIDIIGAGAGIGRLLVVKQQSFDAASVWAILVVIGLFGLFANGLVALAERRVRRGWL